MDSIGLTGITVGYTSRRRQHRTAIRSYFANCLTIVILSIVLSVIGVMLSDAPDLLNIKRYVQAPILFALNALPPMLVLLLLYHLFSRKWASFGIGGGLYLVLHIVNRFQMQLHDKPLTVSELLPGSHPAGALSLSGLPFDRLEIICCIIWLIIAVFLFVAFKPHKLHWLVRIAGMVFAAALLVLSFHTCYQDIRLYDSFTIRGSQHSNADQFKSHGFVYSFLVEAGRLAQ